jgi:hypothetical protein
MPKTTSLVIELRYTYCVDVPVGEDYEVSSEVKEAAYKLAVAEHNLCPDALSDTWQAYYENGEPA